MEGWGGEVGNHLLVDGGVFSETAEFALDCDARGIEWRGLDGVERRAALRVGVMMVVVEIACTVVEPAARCVDESGWIQGVHQVGQCEFRVLSVADLSPAFVVDDPSDDAGVAAVLADEEFELSLELLLLFGVGEDIDYGAIVECFGLAWPKRWHVLDEHETELIAGLIEQSWLHFDL